MYPYKIIIHFSFVKYDIKFFKNTNALFKIKLSSVLINSYNKNRLYLVIIKIID
jgi:hypothetical protein